MIMAVLNYLDDVLYYPILMVILIAAGRIFPGRRAVSSCACSRKVSASSWKTDGSRESIVFPGPHGFDGIPCRYGQYHRRLDGNLPGRSRCRFLDVASGHHRWGDGFHRKYAGPDLQAPQSPGPQLRRPGLLH